MNKEGPSAHTVPESRSPKLLMLSDIPDYLFKVESTTNFSQQERTRQHQLLNLSYHHEKRCIPYTLATLHEKMIGERDRFEKMHPSEQMIDHENENVARQYITTFSQLSIFQVNISLARKNNLPKIAQFYLEIAFSRSDYFDLPSANLIELQSQNGAVSNPDKYSLPFKNPVTKLHISAEIGDEVSVRELLKEYRVDFQDYMNIQPLHMAVKSGNLATVRCLVDECRKKGVKLSSIIDINGKNILMYAMINASETHVDIVRYLLSIEPSLVDHKDNIGFTALDYAICRSNNIEMIDLLIFSWADFNIIPCGIDTLNIFYQFYINTSWVKKELLLPILQRIEYIHPVFFTKPISQLPIIFYPEYIDQLIYLGIIEEAVRLLKIYTDKGGDINHILPSGDTFLFSAVNQKNIGLVSKLIALGADVNFQNRALHTPLSFAIELHCDDIVGVLGNDENIDLNTLLFENQETYLHVVIKSKNLFALKLLFEKMFWNRDQITIFGSSLIDFCLAFDFKEGIDVIMQKNNVIKEELVSRCSAEFTQRIEQRIESLKNVAKHGVISRRKIYDLGLKCSFSHDPREKSDQNVPDTICVNLITEKWAIDQSLTTHNCGSLSVILERQKDPIKTEDDKISANAIYEFSRRANSSFLIVTSKKKLFSSSGIDVDLPLLKNGTCEYNLKEILPSQIDLILFPFCMHPFKEKIASVFGADSCIIFLSDVPNDRFIPKENTIYIDFVPYDKEVMYFKSTVVEAFVPSYSKSVYLEKYFDMVGGDIFTHIVRADECVVLANSNQYASDQVHDDPISDTKWSTHNLTLRMQRLRFSYKEQISDIQADSLNVSRF